MIAYTGFNDIRDFNESRIGEILAMVARNCPKLMKAGGGSLPADYIGCEKRMTDDDRKKIRQLFKAGNHPKEIARKTNWSETSVRRVVFNRVHG